MSNYGSTRTHRYADGARVLCTRFDYRPERISKRTGEKKPWVNLTKVYSGVVLRDNGSSVTVKVIFPSRATRVMTFFGHEVSLEADFNTWRNGLGG